MANNYTEATMTPDVFLTERQEKLLHCYGASCHGPKGGPLYVCWEDHFSEQPDEMDFDEEIADGIEDDVVLPSVEHFLRDILMNPENKDVEALDVEGCYRCDKMRPGDFGGFALMVTRKEYAWCNTGMLRQGKGGKIVPAQIKVHAF